MSLFAFFPKGEESKHLDEFALENSLIMPQLDLTPDQLLTTTRTVRKRLDLARPVELEVVRECIEIAMQAPTSGNTQPWHFVVVTEPEKKQAIADLYRRSFRHILLVQSCMQCISHS